MQTPIALFIFRRPETTARVLDAIAAARPSTLLVVADGPHPGDAHEAAQCAAARDLLARVDWPCRVLTDFSDVNLGLKRRMASGLTWVFDTVPEAIILEDDCLPHPTFFPFCEELLARYRDEERVLHIGGNSFQPRRRWRHNGYHFSLYAHIWGWASWRRAWRLYDLDMRRWPELRARGWLEELLGDAVAAEYWASCFDSALAGTVSTWDYQWLFSSWAAGGASVSPGCNLVSNIGFGVAATHTREAVWLANLPTAAARFPLRHPAAIACDRGADRRTFDRVFGGRERRRHRSLAWRLLRAPRGIARRLRRALSQP